MDNYGSHNTPQVKSWLARHPRFVTHFRPDQLQLGKPDRALVRRINPQAYPTGSFYNVNELIAAIQEFLQVWNKHPRPFVWTATVESIVAKLAGCRQTLEQIQPGCTLPKSRRKPV
jgi:hypothetical protein